MIKFLRSLNEENIYGFLTFKKVEIIEKAEARTHNYNFDWQFNRSDLFFI